jgi:hypothetical protein
VTTLGKVVITASFALALIWTFILWRLIRPKRNRPCAHRWQTVETYADGRKKARCLHCGNIRLLIPRPAWF